MKVKYFREDGSEEIVDLPDEEDPDEVGGPEPMQFPDIREALVGCLAVLVVAGSLLALLVWSLINT